MKRVPRILARLFPIVFFALPLAPMAGCATSQLVIESDPQGADVFAVASGGVRQKIGQTPLTLNPTNQPQIFGNDTQVQVSKDGYRSESFLIPPQASGGNTRIQAKLVEDPVSKSCQDSANALTETTDAVAQIQRMIYKKNYSEAERILQGYVAKFPSIPVFYSLLGNVRYLQKNLDRALEAYTRANQLQPQNQETSRMIQKIKNIRLPAGGGT